MKLKKKKKAKEDHFLHFGKNKGHPLSDSFLKLLTQKHYAKIVLLYGIYWHIDFNSLFLKNRL